MINILSTNITSPLGKTTEENYLAVKAGQSAIAFHEDKFGLPFGFEASLFSDEQWDELMLPDCTRFESIITFSVREALKTADIDVASDRTVLLMSTTKGDIDTPLGLTAKHIANNVGVTTEPIVVCNACISGVASLVLAERLIESGEYDNAIVTGADVQGRFIISGFQALKALSSEPCRPFDIERLGLNLGEASATMILSRKSSSENGWKLLAGAVRNDAYHISSPHPKGEGSMLAVSKVLEGIDKDDLAVVGVHGTATMYNDQMESMAIVRAGLADIPISALKGYYGHTMGATGLLETALLCRALDDGMILPSRGYSMRGVSGKVNISGEEKKTSKTRFVKMLSGFGGCNGAVLLDKKVLEAEDKATLLPEIKSTHSVKITSDSIIVDGEKCETTTSGKAMLTEVYKNSVGDYPKFYKMDILSRLAFIATELLLKAEGKERTEETSDRAVIFFNKTSSIVADRQYEESIADKENFYPSPAAFVYTLPNISTGEVALRNKYHGETSFYVLPERDDQRIRKVLRSSFLDSGTNSIIGGWIDAESEDTFECDIRLLFHVNGK